jgi:hypothetical protein
MDNRGIQVRFSAGKIYFYLLYSVQIISGGHPTSYRGVKVDHSPPTSAEVKKMWIYTTTPPYAFMA